MTQCDVAHEYDLIAKSLLKMMVGSLSSQSMTSTVFVAAVDDLMVSVLFTIYITDLSSSLFIVKTLRICSSSMMIMVMICCR